VGGTTLSSNITTGAYSSESSWGSGSSGGGGGISSKWSLPSWQSGLGTASNGASGTTFRMVPDVSLDANPNTGYSIYQGGSWQLVGGTSAAAPLWAAFAAVVNQGRLANGEARVGFMNPTLYQYGAGGTASSLFHDIADGSTNRHYAAVSGYDLSTGLGTINGLNLYLAFTGPTVPTTVAAASSVVSLTVSWGAVAGATSYKVYRSTTASGTYAAIATGVVATSFADTTSVGVNYYYATTVNATGESAGSLVVSGSINQVVPAAPTGLSGAIQ
jgi:subtilase family serine protease